MKAEKRVRIGLVTAGIMIGLSCLSFIGLIIRMIVQSQKVGSAAGIILLFASSGFVLHTCLILIYAVHLKGGNLVPARRAYRVWVGLWFVIIGITVLPLLDIRESSPVGFLVRAFVVYNSIFALFFAGLRTGIKGLAQILEGDNEQSVERALRETVEDRKAKKSQKRPVEHIDRLENCASCGRAISKSETPWIFKNHIVCAECWKRLKAASGNSTS